MVATSIRTYAPSVVVHLLLVPVGRSQGFPNATAWRAAPASTSSCIVHVTRDSGLAGWQSLLQRSRWLRLTKAAGSEWSARCGAGATSPVRTTLGFRFF